jgi:hypothetical protein
VSAAAGSPLSPASRDSSPKGGAKPCGGRGLPCGGTSPPTAVGTSPFRGGRGTRVPSLQPLVSPERGDVAAATERLFRGAQHVPIFRPFPWPLRPVGQGFYPCLPPRTEQARAEPLPYEGCVKRNICKNSGGIPRSPLAPPLGELSRASETERAPRRSGQPPSPAARLRGQPRRPAKIFALQHFKNAEGRRIPYENHTSKTG